MIEADPAELADDLGESRWLGGQVEQPVAPRPMLEVDRIEPGGQRIEGRLVGEIALVVDDPANELVDDLGFDRHPRIGRQGRRDLLPERVLVVRPPADRDQDELVGQQVRPAQLVQGWQDLAMGQVAGCAEQDDDARIGHPLEAQALAQRVDLPGLLRPALAVPGKAHLADGPVGFPGGHELVSGAGRARSSARSKAASPPSGSASRWIRRTGSWWLSRAWKSPAAWASISWPKVYGQPGIGRSWGWSAVSWKNRPIGAPPLCSWPVECRNRGP